MSAAIGKTEPIEASAHAALHILLVDDEAIARLILSRPLLEQGHRIVMASSGNEALQILAKQEFDLVLLDIGMRDGDGFMVLDALRSQNLPRWVPIIVTSGHQSDEQIMRALELGADDYMVKPLNIPFLRYKIRNFQRVILLQKQNLDLLASVTQKQISLEERIALEFEYSSRIQETLLFGSVPLAPGGIFISARAEAAQGINGDFFEFISVYPDSVDLIVGDVMGKGPLAAILGADVKLQVQREITQRLVNNPQTRFGVAEIVNAIHTTLTPKLIKLGSFVTLLYARLDKAAGTLTLVCCGHPPLVLTRDGHSSLFGSHNLPLGILADEVYTEESCPILPGTSVMSYSDGLSEAVNAQGEGYGDARLLEDLNAFPQARWGANALVERTYASVLQFVGEGQLRDDLTLVVAKVPRGPVMAQRLVLPRSNQHITELRHFLEAFAQAEQISPELCDQLTLVAVEAFTNTVRHCGSGFSHSGVEIQVYRHGAQLGLTLEALGPYFDPDQRDAEPLDPTDLSREGGFGLHIMRSLAERCDFLHQGGVNRAEFSFRIAAEPA